MNRNTEPFIGVGLRQTIVGDTQRYYRSPDNCVLKMELRRPILLLLFLEA